jgi:hypothetical protein
MNEITAENVKDFFSYEKSTGKLFWKVKRSHNALIGEEAGCVEKRHGYRVIRVLNHRYKAHRIVWLYVYGKWPSGIIDHINRNKTDNRVENLRDTTTQINNLNKGLSKASKTGIKNITWHTRDNRYRAAFTINGKQKHLGYFKSIEEAMSAVQSFDRNAKWEGK